MRLLGSCVIGVVLGALGICVIDFDPIAFNLNDTIILAGVLIIWQIIYDAISGGKNDQRTR